MKTSLLLALLVGLIYYYYHDATPAPGTENSVSARPASTTVAAPAMIIASAPSSYDRWKTGPNAQTNLKTGPDAQTDFAPFAPSEQATWNQTPGYTIVSGRTVRKR
jgi:hypothetical protein